MSKFKKILDTAKNREEEPLEPLPEVAPVVPQPAPTPPKVKQGRRSNGKSSNPDYEQVTSYIRRDTHHKVKKALIGTEKDFSELLEELLTKWLKSHT